MSRPKKPAENGFTFIETLAAMGFILIAFASLIPLYMAVSNYTLKNRAKSQASNIASREMERIRNLSYDKVGVVNGNPNGTLQADKEETEANGLIYHIETRVWWVDDSFDGTAAQGTDSMPNDYKKAQVSVMKSGTTEVLAQISSNVARESEESPSNGGNILTQVLKPDGVTPIEGVSIQITTGPSSPQVGWTDNLGNCIFAELQPSQIDGDYSLTATKSGYVVRPDQEILTTTVVFGQTRNLTFIMDAPGHLIINLRDPGGNIIDKQSKVTLTNPDSGSNNYNSSNGIFDFINLFPGSYDIMADAAAYNPTTSPVTATVTAGQTTTIDITLQPTPSGHLHLEVFDYSTNGRLGVCDVKLTNQTTGDIIDVQTNSSGILEIDLEVAYYTMDITASGYTPYTDTINITASGNTNYNAYLQGYATVGSILVRTETRSHNPRNGVWVRVTGTGYDVSKQTGSYAAGEALFDSLPPGDYRVYRWGGSGWRFPRNVTVTAGNQSSVIYSY